MCPSKSATCLGVNAFTVPSSARTPVTSFVARNQLMKYYNEKYGKWIKLYPKIKE